MAQSISDQGPDLGQMFVSRDCVYPVRQLYFINMPLARHFHRSILFSVGDSVGVQL